jgi:hypothetical protein
LSFATLFRFRPWIAKVGEFCACGRRRTSVIRDAFARGVKQKSDHVLTFCNTFCHGSLVGSKVSGRGVPGAQFYQAAPKWLDFQGARSARTLGAEPFCSLQLAARLQVGGLPKTGVCHEAV